MPWRATLLTGAAAVCAWAVVPRPPAQQLKADLARILAGPEYQQPGLTWQEKLLAHIMKWLADNLGMSLSALHQAWPGLYWAIVGLLVLVLLLVLYHIAMTIGRAFTERRPRQPAPPRTPAPDPEALRSRALELAAAGELTEALRVLYEALLRRLDRQDVLRFDGSRTNWETADALRGRPALAPVMEDLASRLDGVLYASLPVAPEDFAHCRGLVERAWGEGGQAP